MIQDVESWRRLGKAAQQAQNAVSSAFCNHLRDSDPGRYAALLDDFRAKTAAALPSTDPAFLPGVAANRVHYVDVAIAFLEADPWFFRSGYEKQKIIRHLKRISLADPQRTRLAGIVLAAIDGRDRAEFRHFGRLACGIWCDFLDDGVATRMVSDDPGIRRRAVWVAEAAISAGKA